ncbi:MAG: SGNH/GDSL hydrolase family protein [Leptolyngbyaceae cyanobacterium SL_7_1]|nr:SGNH/GDSL hydrolase family protein [Leptolyngbyaceae cyanobacterium SL_7_1]
MKYQLFAASVFAATCCFSGRAIAADFSGIYVFGDSLSDTGNLFNVTEALLGTGSPPPPYFEGRITNGPNWIDFLAEELELNPTPITEVFPGQLTQGINFAFAGATSGSDNTLFVGLPGLAQQAQTFLSLLPPTGTDPNALYIVWTGANDYLPTNSLSFTPYTTPDFPIASITNIISGLSALGAQNFLVPNLPDLGKVPSAVLSGNSTALSALTTEHNLRLSNTLALLDQTLPNSTFYSLDTNTLFNEAIAGSLGFTNVYNSLSQSCRSNRLSKPQRVFILGFRPSHLRRPSANCYPCR